MLPAIGGQTRRDYIPGDALLAIHRHHCHAASVVAVQLLAALALVLAGAAGQTDPAAMPFGPKLGYWRFSAHNSPVFFSCRLLRKTIFLSGSCLSGGFKSDGIAYGVIDGSEVHVSIYFERLDDNDVSFDFAGTLGGDTISGTMLTTDGARADFEATPGVIPPSGPAPLVVP